MTYENWLQTALFRLIMNILRFRFTGVLLGVAISFLMYMLGSCNSIKESDILGYMHNGYIMDANNNVCGHYSNGYILDTEKKVIGTYRHGYIFNSSDSIIARYSNGYILK